MPDFRDELERGLRRAAERRWDEQPRRSRSGGLLALAGAAVAVAIAVAVVLSLRPPAGTTPAAQGGGFVLRAALPARGCSTPHALPDASIPRQLRNLLGVLQRPQRAPDGLPVLNEPGGGSNDFGWLPLASVSFRGVRLVHEQPDVWLVPSRAVLMLGERALAAPCPGARRAPRHHGACLVAGVAGGPLAVRCFTVPEIEEGRAAAVLEAPVGRGQVVVLVPDGVATVGGVAARENLAVLPPGAARAGERVRLVLVPQARRVGRAPDGAAVYSSLAVRGRTCPGDALPLRRGDVAAAAAAVKRVIRALVPRGGTPGIDTTGAIVRGSSSAGLAGAPAQADCGPFARRRSVVVDARFPRVTFSAALAHAIYYVAREPRGWVVWGLGPG